MAAPANATERARVSIAAALMLAFTPLPWLLYAVQRASFAGLGRDQGIFQGTAWAIAHGAVLYRDLREINGPLVHEIHLLVRALGGADAHVLRCFDLGVSALVFAFVGASLPGATQPRPERRSAAEQLGWALAACVVLLAQYVSFYDAWHLTQRESMYDWFVLAGFGCGLRALGSADVAAARVWLVLAGIASATPWFGKPLCLVYTPLHVLVFAWMQPRPGLQLRQRLLAFFAGLAIGCGLQAAFLAIYCSIPEFLRIYLYENPRYYRYVWPHMLEDILALDRHNQRYLLAIITALFALALVALRRMGRQMLGLALFPLVGIGLDLLQGKGFVYHLHPVTAGAALLAVALVCHACGSTQEPAERGALGWWPVLLAAVIAHRTAVVLLGSPHLGAAWAVEEGSTRERRLEAGFLAHYDTKDFASAALGDVGRYLAQRTRPDDRIQLYGMDPYLLALAERQSATPYVYSCDLNPDAIVAGIEAVDGSAQARAAAKAIADRNVADFTSRVQRDNPAAFVLFDRAPFLRPEHAIDELLTHVPQLRTLLRKRYREVHTVGLLHVYLRDDRRPDRGRTAQSRGAGMPPVSSK
jgi:hypothetical protein